MTIYSRISYLLLWLVIGVVGRILPHPANITPLTSLSIFAGIRMPRFVALGLMLLTLLISDAVLAYFFAYPFMGSWSLFTYSGFLMIVLAAKLFHIQEKYLSLLEFTCCASLGFWLWTNFGVWCLSGIYQHNLADLVACYIRALPFLRNALIGDMVWMSAIYALLHFAIKPQMLRNPQRITHHD